MHYRCICLLRENHEFLSISPYLNGDHELILSCRFDQLQPQKHGVEFRRPTTLARGDPLCDFILQKVPRQRISRGAAPF